MKAVTYTSYGGPDVIQIKEVNEPQTGPNQVKIRVHHLSINPYDWRFMRGEPRFIRLEHGLFRPSKQILGNDISGEVIDVGEEVSKFKVGDQVIAAAKLGGFAEIAVIDQGRMVVKPTHFNLAQSAGLIMAGVTANEAITTIGKVGPNERVLINGASGGIGHYAVQICKHIGAKVTGVCSEKNHDFIRSLGATDTIDYNVVDLSNLDQQFDCVIDIQGNLSVSTYRKLIGKSGRVIVVGFTTMPDMIQKMIAQRFGKLNLKVVEVDEDEVTMQKVVDLANQGVLTTHISKCYPMEDFSSAIAHSEQGHAVGKVIVDIPLPQRV